MSADRMILPGEDPLVTQLHGLTFQGSELTEQFVSNVLNFSTEYGANAYCSQRIIGQPSRFPDYGDFADCFVVRTYGTWWQRCPSAAPPIDSGIFTHRDFIEVAFQDPVVPKTVKVFETYHPGSVVRILARPSGAHAGKWVALWSGEPQVGLPAKARIFCPPLKRVDFMTSVLRIELDSKHLEYYAEFDAIQLTGVAGSVPEDYVPEHADTQVMRANEVLYHEISDEQATKSAPSKGILHYRVCSTECAW